MDQKAEDGSPKIQFTVEDDRGYIKELYLKTFASVVSRATRFGVYMAFG